MNLFVSDLERSREFYEDVVGLTVVFREVDLGAVFFSNGNSHHDFAIFEARDEDRYDAKGVLQISRERGGRVRLNHVAFEASSSEAIALGCRRALDAGHDVQRAFDHGISRSVYFADPDGASCEVYADSITDWRRFFDERAGEVVTVRWDPIKEGGLAEHHYPVDPELVPRAGAAFATLRLDRFSMVTTDLGAGLRHYRDLIGMTALHSGEGWAVLGGSDGRPGLGLFEFHDRPAGLHHSSFAVAGANDLDAGCARLELMAVPFERVSTAAKEAVLVADPDGYLIEIFALDSVNLDDQVFARMTAAEAIEQVF